MTRRLAFLLCCALLLLLAGTAPLAAQPRSPRLFGACPDTAAEAPSPAAARIRSGDCHWYQGRMREALLDYETARSLSLAAGDSLGMAVSLRDLGRVFWQTGDYLQAMDYQLQALALRMRAGDSLQIADSYFWIGVLKAELADYDAARSYYAQALRIAEQAADTLFQADILHYTARSWRKQNRFDAALEAHARSRASYEAVGSEAGLAEYYNNVGSIYRRQGQYGRAQEFFFKGLELQQRLRIPGVLADAYNDIGLTYCQMGLYDQALPYLQRALAEARSSGILDDVRYAYEGLAAVHDSLGEFRRAYAYLRLRDRVKDSLMDQRKSDQIALLGVRYERERQQQELELLRTQYRANFQLGGAVLAVLGVLGGALFFRSRYQTRITRKLQQQTEAIELERRKAETLLQNILPVQIAEHLKARPYAKPPARRYNQVSVMFVDFHGFTRVSERLSPEQLVDELHQCFLGFDQIIARHGLEKIKTIGDAYMCAGGLPEENETHAHDTVRAGLEIQTMMAEVKRRRQALGLPFFEARVGIHTGPVVAGVVGSRKFAYDIWGDTVNTASRIESSGEVGKVNISDSTFRHVQHDFICRHRGRIPAKNKGEIDMYFVEWAI
ncbi:MAG: adenylate/guanylate cyclase domain-containing protein [Bacteroidia bacterium]|nr:adenylate/guanylate cyclase domain-containing protein [Bacteroidia bacterium]